jgi:hypothetical protein
MATEDDAARPVELVDAGEIAKRLGLRHRNVVLDWRLHRLNFPAPVARRRTYLWRWRDVEEWFARNRDAVATARARDER